MKITGIKLENFKKISIKLGDNAVSKVSKL
jgi:hypothetical protein